LHDRTQKLLGG